MRVNLPSRIELTCPECRSTFTVNAGQLHERLELGCPFCLQGFSVYDALPDKLKRKVYYTLRDEMEHLVYKEYRKHEKDYFDVWGANVSSDSPDEPS